MRPPHDVWISLELDPARPLVLQIVRGLASAIARGQLQPGQALPGSRVLSQTLGVHRNTVLAAVRELEAEGWLETRPASGTYVAQHLPDAPPRTWGLPRAEPEGPPEPGFDVPEQLRPITAPFFAELNLSEGLPDVRLAPREAMAKGYQRAIRLHGDELLSYGEPRGNATFRRLLADMLRERRGLRVEPDQILVTRGSRMALDLVSMALFRPGTVVAVEDPGQRAIWETIQQGSQARLRAVPVDAEGLRTDALEDLLRREKVDLLYLTPHRQVPTTVSLSPARRAELLRLARQHRMAILEEDSEGEYAYEGSPLEPLAAGDATGQVIYLSSLSRLVAPGVRLGFVVAPASLVDRLARVRVRMDWQGDRVLEWTMGEVLRDGDLTRHLRKVRRLYKDRRDLLADGLERHFAEHLALQRPDGGLALWVRGREGFDLNAWIGRCRERSLILHPGRHFSFASEDLQATRIGFAAHTEDELKDALGRMRAAL